MTLTEQLFELRTNILRDRSDIIAGDTDSLWTDETLINYIADAERRFSRRTLMLRDDNTPGVVTVTLKSGVKTYPLNRAIISVISARYDTVPSDLARAGHAQVSVAQPTTYFSFQPTDEYVRPPGRPIAYYTDETLVGNRNFGVNLSVYPVPGTEEDGKKIYMRVIRTPLTEYNIDCQNRESEIPDDYVLDVLEWAAYRAQRTFDADAGAPTSAADHQTAFELAIKRALQETKRRMLQDMRYANGRNGFSWTR